jgi:monofunctional biosynthetic peptidoglycan transglycosylase
MDEGAPSQSTPRRRPRPILIALLILALLPIGGVLIHAVLPPPMTLLMMQQKLINCLRKRLSLEMERI